MTPPFPALHRQANEDALETVEAARARTEAAAVFLGDLDTLLDDLAA